MWIFGVSILLVVSLSFLLFGKQGVGRIIDRIGITKDSYVIQVDDKIKKDIFIYWLGESGIRDEHNRELIYHMSLTSKIPSSYGKNILEIKYKNICYNKIGIWKTYAYAKYNYLIKISTIDNNLQIEWSIKNWYDSEIMQGFDTIKFME